MTVPPKAINKEMNTSRRCYLSIKWQPDPSSYFRSVSGYDSLLTNFHTDTVDPEGDNPEKKNIPVKTKFTLHFLKCKVQNVTLVKTAVSTRRDSGYLYVPAKAQNGANNIKLNRAAHVRLFKNHNVCVHLKKSAHCFRKREP